MYSMYIIIMYLACFFLIDTDVHVPVRTDEFVHCTYVFSKKDANFDACDM